MKWLMYLLFGGLLALAANFEVQAQVMVDMSKFTCGQLLGGSQDAIEASIWMSGYYNGLRKNTMIDLNTMKHNADAVVAACHSSPNKTVMQTVNMMLAPKKK
jgi:HdeA/HdeB family